MNEYQQALKELENLFDVEDSKERDSKRKLLTDKFKLQGLYDRQSRQAEEEAVLENAELAAIREMLEPLCLAKPETPVSEMVRILIMNGINRET